MKSSESSEEESSLGWADESQSLDGFGSMSSSSLDSLGGVRLSSSGVLKRFVVLVVGFVCDEDVVLSSERFSGLGGGSGDIETESLFLGESLSRGVVHAGQVQWISRETVLSRSPSFWLSNK